MKEYKRGNRRYSIRLYVAVSLDFWDGFAFAHDIDPQWMFDDFKKYLIRSLAQKWPGVTLVGFDWHDGVMGVPGVNYRAFVGRLAKVGSHDKSTSVNPLPQWIQGWHNSLYADVHSAANRYLRRLRKWALSST